MNNRHDPVPIVPGRLLGFRHPRGEVHIELDGHAVTCPGERSSFLVIPSSYLFLLYLGADDGKDPQCSDRMVPNIEEGNIIDHLGPYHGIFIGTTFCTP